jgi:hypothetical protein
MNWKLALIGSAVALGAFALSVHPASAADNHYACYQVKSKAPDPGNITLSDAIGGATGTAAKCKQKFVCVPVIKNGNAIVNPALSYSCWQCKGGKPAVTFTVTDQFGGNSVTSKKLKLVCNPATTSL